MKREPGKVQQNNQTVYPLSGRNFITKSKTPPDCILPFSTGSHEEIYQHWIDLSQPTFQAIGTPRQNSFWAEPELATPHGIQFY